MWEDKDCSGTFIKFQTQEAEFQNDSGSTNAARARCRLLRLITDGKNGVRIQDGVRNQIAA